MSDRIGCVAPRSIVETPYGVFFLSEDHGICRTNGQSVDRVSGKILPLLRSIPPAMRASVCAAFLNDHLYVAIATGTANDLLLDLDVKQNAWWIHSLAMSDIVTWGSRGGPRAVRRALRPAERPAAARAGPDHRRRARRRRCRDDLPDLLHRPLGDLPPALPAQAHPRGPLRRPGQDRGVGRHRLRARGDDVAGSRLLRGERPVRRQRRVGVWRQRRIGVRRPGRRCRGAGAEPRRGARMEHDVRQRHRRPRWRSTPTRSW
jgi:hypothetical protein